MNMTMFEQFASPEIMLMPTTLIAMLMPIALIRPKQRLLGNRMSVITNWALKIMTFNMTSHLSNIGQKWSRFLLALMLVIVISNLIGLMPYTFTTTSQLSMNMSLAVPMWMATLITGLTMKPSSSLAHMLPEGSPTPLIPFMIMIETVSLLMRPIALGVRLTANITAGHLLMTMISSAALNFAGIYNSLSITMMILLLLLSILETAVACIQAYVFVLLVTLYLQENT